jgi:hypothetical protein
MTEEEDEFEIKVCRRDNMLFKAMKDTPENHVPKGDLKRCRKWSKYGLFLMYKSLLRDTVELEDRLKQKNDARLRLLEERVLELEEEKEALEEEIDPLRELKEHLEAIET